MQTLDTLENLLQLEIDRHDAARVDTAIATPVNEAMYAWTDVRPRFDLESPPGLYELLILPTALVALEMLPRRGQMQLARLIDRLSRDWLPPEAEPLCTLPEFFRLRTAGTRLLYGADEDSQSVLVVGLWPDRRPS
jgi:mRNA-degrading endonuclease RelE of RelBE toxin-antitoxin system